MKTIPLLVLLSLSFSTSAWAGEIYGTIKEGGQPVKNAQVEITSSGNKEYKATTDEFGNYRIVVAETGKCALTVQFNGSSATATVQSYSTPVRFNWLLEKSGNGYSLKRQ